jgi:5-methyltetrahydrofolate--homocysteine methyltransferase
VRTASDTFLELLDERVVVLDGAMGTSIHERQLELHDYAGLENCPEILVTTRPDVVQAIHASFLEVGCDAIETDTFGGTRIVLADWNAQDRSLELNRTAARLAREVARAYSTARQPRFVVGSMGPGNKSPLLGQVSFDEVHAAYSEQAQGLIEGGADVLLVETCFDMLQCKAATIACIDTMRRLGVKRPLMVQVTIEAPPLSTMLSGTEIGAALVTLEALPVDVIGINCATGPEHMADHVRYLSRHCTRRISVLPNAGLPETVDGQARFPLTPDGLADALAHFVNDLGVNIVGGCCGTTPRHLARVVERLRGVRPKPRQPVAQPALSCLFAPQPLQQEPRPLIIGERTNTNGSKKFKELLAADDFEGMLGLAREQEQEGSHVLDVCTAYVGRDEVRDMNEVVGRFNKLVRVPLCIDTTELPVLEAALKRISGKPVINSINLEDGRVKLDRVVPLAKRFGAALIALAIDEEGQARTAGWKFRVCQRIYRICTEEYGLAPSDLLFDALTFPIATGQLETRPDGVELLNAIRRVKRELPGCFTVIGLSNISFGLKPAARTVLNSVFLHHAIEAGLDAAILHAAKILPLAQIPPAERELAERLIFETDSVQPVMDAVAFYEKAGSRPAQRVVERPAAVEDRLKQAIIRGRRDTLLDDLDLARQTYSPLDIINQILLDGMRAVGDLFGSGQMQLPFVLQSAEVMKAAVRHLEPFLEKAEGAVKGRLVLATVKGDVHDIGKNLVDIILTNNGYKVYNLGTKCPVDRYLQVALDERVDAIGLSGLLVKSTVVMRDDLQELTNRGVTLPVICGGAALTRRYVEEDLSRQYRGRVFYGKDAFTGLHIMDELCGHAAADPESSAQPRAAGRECRVPAAARRLTETGPAGRAAAAAPAAVATRPGRRRSRAAECPSEDAALTTLVSPSTVAPAPDIPAAPFLGSRIVSDIDPALIFPYLNERALVGTQWQFRKGGVNPRDYERLMHETVYPLLDRMKAMCLDQRLLQPRVVYGFFPCQSDANDLLIYDAEGRTERLRFQFPRQPDGEQLCISDFFAPRDSGRMDVVAMHLVTVGRRIGERCHELFAADQYTDYLYLHGLSVELTEALAEYWHQQIRRAWGIAAADSPDIQKLFHLHYRGCRWSFGYPACPTLEDQGKLFELLNPERIGVALTESFQLDPEQSTSALIAHHPGARYFNV